MGKFAWFSTIPHKQHTIEILISGNTEVESETADIGTRALGLCGLVKVSTKNLFDGEDQYHTVDTYEEIHDLLKSSYQYLKHLKYAINNYHAATGETALLKSAHKKIYDDVWPAACALYCIDEGISETGWMVSLDGVKYDSDISDESSQYDEAEITPNPQPEESLRPKTPLPNPIPMPIQNQVQPTASRIPPIPAPRKKIHTALVPAAVAPIPVAKTNKTATIIKETAPPPSYQDVMEPKNDMENYYGREEQATFPRLPTVEIIPSRRDLHHPASTQQVVFRTHTAHQTPSVLDRIGTMTLDAASRIAEANSSLATAALQKMKKLRVTKTYGYGVT